MAGSDEIIHQLLRLKVMAALYASPNEALQFARLKTLVQATDGNLGSHLAALERAGYIRLMKDFFHNKPRTRAIITPSGARAFQRHARYLRTIVGGAA